MTPHEIAEAKAKDKYPIPAYDSGNIVLKYTPWHIGLAHEAYISGFKEGMELAGQHIAKFWEWVVKNEFGYHHGAKNWKLEHMPVTYTTQQLFEQYLSTIK